MGLKTSHLETNVEELWVEGKTWSLTVLLCPVASVCSFLWTLMGGKMLCDLAVKQSMAGHANIRVGKP